MTANGVTLLAKNRDAKPAVQEMKLYKNGGIAYYGFSDTGSTYLTAGFNAKGLAIVVAKLGIREKGTQLGKRVHLAAGSFSTNNSLLFSGKMII